MTIITPQDIDTFSLFSEHFVRALEANTEDAIVIAQQVLSNATTQADRLTALAGDERFSQAQTAISNFFGYATGVAERLAPSLTPEIQEVHTSFTM